MLQNSGRSYLHYKIQNSALMPCMWKQLPHWQHFGALFLSLLEHGQISETPFGLFTSMIHDGKIRQNCIHSTRRVSQSFSPQWAGISVSDWNHTCQENKSLVLHWPLLVAIQMQPRSKSVSRGLPSKPFRHESGENANKLPSETNAIWASLNMTTLQDRSWSI